ncbi:MAG: Uma2 family endonuclease [Candidatus Magnetoovum sp. WYHC-5]|nr:Uma2 family endonuclease [Candidatus Magnetoovum sp. WYHC-5]
MITSNILLDNSFDLTEIINGDEVMGPSPFFKHQDVLNKLNILLSLYVNNKGIGKVCISPLDVIFEDGINRLQPDLIFIKKENMAIAQDWIRGVPDMVCEIVSTGSVAKDTITKKEIYERYRVPEYWIVIQELKTIEVLVFANDSYKIFSIAEGEGVVQSKIIEGLEFEIQSIFNN